jgi:hypothetical protein
MPIAALSDIAGLELSLDGDTVGDFTLPTGVEVGQWNDQSGNARHVTPATTGDRPFRDAVSPSGRTGVRFNGDRHLAVTGFTLTQPGTIYVVANVPNSVDQSIYDSFSTGDRWALNRWGNDTINIAQGGSDIPFAGITSSLHVWAHVANGSTSQLWVDGVKQNGDVNPGGNNLVGFALGRQFGGANELNGNVFAVAIYSGAHTSGQIADVYAYLNTRYLVSPYPVVEGVAETAVITAGTSHAITLPAGITSTDETLILMDIGSTAATVNALTDWTELLDENLANGLKIIRYTGAGVPSAPTFVTSAATRSATLAYRISNADKATAPQIATTATGTSLTPDPPSLTPTGGISKAYLSIAFFGQAGEEADDDTWANTPPTNSTPSPPRQKACGTVGTNLGGLIASAERSITTGSAIDPGTFNVDVSAAWRAQHVLVHPAPAPPAAASLFLPRRPSLIYR